MYLNICSASVRLSASLGLPPFARLKLVHSSEAHRTTRASGFSALHFRRCATKGDSSRVLISSVKCIASGWLAAWEAIAFASWLTQAITLAHSSPSSLAVLIPVEVPPAPQNRSMYRRFIIFFILTFICLARRYRSIFDILSHFLTKLAVKCIYSFFALSAFSCSRHI